MKMFKDAVAAFVIASTLAYAATSVQAASAHNSRAGANGPVSNNAAPTGRHLGSHPPRN